MNLSISFKVFINGIIGISDGWNTVGWQPVKLDLNEEKADTFMEAYELDRREAWYIYRLKVKWPLKKRQEIKLLSLKLSTDREAHSCNTHFTCKPNCEPFDVSFLNPINGEACILKVHSFQQVNLPEEFLSEEDKAHPHYFGNLKYSLDPALSPEQTIVLQDCSKSDLLVSYYLKEKEGDSLAVKNVTSSMYFEPVQEVKWFISVQVTPCQPKQIDFTPLNQSKYQPLLHNYGLWKN